MIEQGTVQEILPDGRARVFFETGPGCIQCSRCLKSGEHAYVEAVNETGANRGDAVWVEVHPLRVVQAAFLLFILPPLALIAGYFVAGLPTAFISLFLSFLLVHLYDRFLRDKKSFWRIIERR
jgi:positive regulator of sigma E activity